MNAFFFAMMDFPELRTKLGVPSAAKKWFPVLASFAFGGSTKQLFLPGGVMTAADVRALKAAGSVEARAVASKRVAMAPMVTGAAPTAEHE